MTIAPATSETMGGKMLRALLVFLIASATGTDPRRMIKVASALELLHGASLIHDDIVDEAYERRGHPALHVQVGVGPALVLGDYLILRSFTVLHNAVEAVSYRNSVSRAARMMNHYAEACCLGELQELLRFSRVDPEVEYIAIVHGKTASQFASAATVPAILTGRPLAEIEALRAYGLNVGVAFQIHDDVLDLIGDPAVMGKPVGTSLTNGRPLLPLIYLERDGSAAARREYARLRQAKERRADLVALLKEEGILDGVKATQNKYLSNAIQALDRLRPDHDVAELEVLAPYAVSRQR